MKLGYRRIVVFPYFLFSGVLVSRIVQHSQRVADDHPELQILQASYLGDHPEVLATFQERVEDVLRGDTDMNCSLCKYRAQVLGFETEVGAPQHSHHHHVEGLVESCNLCERECTGACQEDGVPLPGGGTSPPMAMKPPTAITTAPSTTTTPPTPTPTTPWAHAPCGNHRPRTERHKTTRESEGIWLLCARSPVSSRSESHRTCLDQPC